MKHYIDQQGNLHGFKLDGSQDSFIKPGMTLITDEAMQAIIEKKNQEILDSRTYDQKRAAEYPSIADQLDAIWKGLDSMNEMQEKIMAIKDRYPKP